MEGIESERGLKVAQMNIEGCPAEFIRLKNMRQDASIEVLSDDALRSIFSYLTLPDIHHRVALVSKKWKGLSRDQRFGPKCVELTANDGKDLRIRNIGAVKYFNQTIRRVTINECIFVCSAEDIESLVDLLKKCANLQKLTISGRLILDDFSFFSAFLSSLKVRLFSGFSNLLSSLGISRKSNELKDIHRANYMEDKYDTGAFFRKLTNADENTMIKLKLKSNFFDDGIVAKVKELDFQLLTELTLDEAAYESLTENAALNIASNFTLLKILKIGCGCKLISYMFGQNALNAFPSLRKVLIVKPTCDGENVVDIDALRNQLTNEISSEDYSWALNEIFYEGPYFLFAIKRKKPQITE